MTYHQQSCLARVAEQNALEQTIPLSLLMLVRGYYFLELSDLLIGCTLFRQYVVISRYLIPKTASPVNLTASSMKE